MIVKERIPGRLVADGDRFNLRLEASDSENQIFLAYALVTQGPEHQILPSVLLDDWGNEIKGLGIYQWINENGLHFPRAEVFGFSPTGTPAQYFLRDLELFTKYPVYAFSDQDASDSSGVSVGVVLIPTGSIDTSQPIEPPEGISVLLRRGQVDWQPVATQ
jgi:hypothetical protein